jgi:hypothetical protein
MVLYLLIVLSYNKLWEIKYYFDKKIYVIEKKKVRVKKQEHCGFKFLFPKSFNVMYNVFIATFHYGIILKGYMRVW